MDAEQTIAEIECLEHIFPAPVTRPLSPSDVQIANRGFNPHNAVETKRVFLAARESPTSANWIRSANRTIRECASKGSG
jgi:hypothetical protein